MEANDPSMEKSLTTFSEFVQIAGQQPTRNELHKQAPLSEHNHHPFQSNCSRIPARCNPTGCGRKHPDEFEGCPPQKELLSEAIMEKTTEIRRRSAQKLQNAYRMVNQVYRRWGLDQLYPEGTQFSTRGDMLLTPNDFQCTRKRPPSGRFK